MQRTDIIEDETEAQIALADARLDVANGKPVTPDRYRALILSIQRGRESRAKHLSTVTKAKAKATKASQALTMDQMQDMFRQSLNESN